MDERIDVLDEHGELTGEAVWKSEAHRRGLWHRCFHCWISGLDDSLGPYLLAQRRAPRKDTWPGYLDVSAAGHLQSGEGPLDGLRELEEELGLSPEPERLIRLGTRRIEQRIPGGLDREFHTVFLLLDSTPPERMRLQEGEVASMLRIRLDYAQKLGGGEAVTVEEWVEGNPSRAQVSLADFVPNDDDYLQRVTKAAREALSGRDPGEVFRL